MDPADRTDVREVTVSSVARLEGTAGDGGLTPPLAPPVVATLTAVRAAVDGVAAVDLDACATEELAEVAATAQSAIDQLTHLRMRTIGAIQSRAVRAVPPGREQRELRAVRDGLADELKLPASAIEREGRTARHLAELPAAQEAAASGSLPAAHATVLTETLQLIGDPERRGEAEARLLAAAPEQDIRTFGRTARAVLVELDADAAQRRIDRQHAQRSLRVSYDADGLLQIHGQGAGLDAEFVQTALHAHRRPDAPDQRRNAGQRTWDALVDLCRSVLDAGTAPTDRGVRPHVLVTVAEPVVADRDGSGNGLARTPWADPLPFSEVRRLLADASVSRVLLDASSLPVEAGVAVRTVPAAVRKAILVRDQVCIADGCDVPAGWCDVMHLEVPYRLDGRLTMASAGLGCRYHHRRFDLDGWRITRIRGRPVLHPPGRPPRASP